MVLLILLLSSVAVAQQDLSKGFQPFDLSANKAFTSPQLQWSNTPSYPSLSQDGFDFLSPQGNGYSVHLNQNTTFGDEIIMGMKFSDLLSVRLNLIDGHQSYSLFSPQSDAQAVSHHNNSELAGFQVGVSSVVNIGSQWKLGFDLGKGQINGDVFGLYQDDLNTTRLGLGVRYNQFGATVNSDFYSRASTDLLEQSTLDIKVDWHFTKEGTISFGARKSINEGVNSSILDQLTGTVPYIKFKHNL